VVPPAPTEVTLVPAPPAMPLLAPPVIPSGMPSVKTYPQRARGVDLSNASAAVSPDTAATEPFASGLECRTGQHRCDGRILQVCNDSGDGWTDVIACDPDAVCDATGAGRCSPDEPLESR